MAKMERIQNCPRAMANLLKMIRKVNDSLKIKYCGISVHKIWIKIMKMICIP